MKKGLTILVVVIMLVTFTTVSFAWDANAAYGKPVIDGKIDDVWSKADVMTMNPNETLSGTCKALWDENNLYFLYEMKDSALNAAGENVNNDSVEMWIDQGNKDGNPERISGNDLVARVDINNKVTFQENAPTEVVKSAVVKGTDGYVVEVQVKLTLKGKEGMVMGFTPTANTDDNGDGKRDGYINNNAGEYWWKPAAYDNLHLTGTPDAAAATENPKTGDSMMWLYVAMGAMVVLGASAMTLRKKADVK